MNPLNLCQVISEVNITSRVPNFAPSSFPGLTSLIDIIDRHLLSFSNFPFFNYFSLQISGPYGQWCSDMFRLYVTLYNSRTEENSQLAPKKDQRGWDSGPPQILETSSPRLWPHGSRHCMWLAGKGEAWIPTYSMEVNIPNDRLGSSFTHELERWRWDARRLCSKHEDQTAFHWRSRIENKSSRDITNSTGLFSQSLRRNMWCWFVIHAQMAIGMWFSSSIAVSALLSFCRLSSPLGFVFVIITGQLQSWSLFLNVQVQCTYPGCAVGRYVTASRAILMFLWSWINPLDAQ